MPADPAADATVPHDRQPPAPRRELPAGSMLNERYRLVSTLGAGTSGTVYRASDQAFDREVAVKVLTGGGLDGVALFLREARITAQLDHPNIVPIHDLVWLDDGGIAFAMKHVDGITLRAALAQAIAGTAPDCLATVNALLTVFLKVCDGVARAHARGVVHRDIKPDNIVIGQFGEVIVLDWGEASTVDARNATAASPVGTPLYMSPEQARGEHATPASDIYAIGGSLFHCLLRRPALDTARLEPAEFWERKRQGTWDAPTPVEAAHHDRRLLAILTKALQADPAARYPGVRALADDLAAYQAGLAVSAFRESWPDRLARWHRRNARTVWLGTSLAAAIAVLAGVLWGDHLERMAHWGRPVLSEGFAPGWEQRWTVCDGRFAVEDGRLIGNSDPGREVSLLLARELPPQSAIEFTGEILPGAAAGDLSVFWIEGEPPTAGQRWATSGRAWMFQVGTWDNTCTVLANLSRSVVAYRPQALTPGRQHRIRAEVDGVHRRLSIDGRTIIDHEDWFHADNGRWLLYTGGSGKAFADVRVWIRGSAELIPALSAPDLLRRHGHHREAAAAWSSLAAAHDGTRLADQARFRAGVALSEIGDWPAALAAWQPIADTDLGGIASGLALGPLLETDPPRLVAEIRGRWPAAGPKVRRALLLLWIGAAQHWQQSALACDGPLSESMLALRRGLFPDAAEADLATLNLARWSGRLRSALDLIANRWIRGQALAILGEDARLLREGTHGQQPLASARLTARPGAYQRRDPEDQPVPDWLATALAGDAVAVQRARRDAGDTAAADWLGQLLLDPRPGLGRLRYDPSQPVCLWLHALATGDAAAARNWEDEVLRRREADRALFDQYLPMLVAPVGILAGLGRLEEARAQVARLRAVPLHQWLGSAIVWGEALADTVEPTAQLPTLVHAAGFAAAVRADLAGDRVAAAARYRAWFDRVLPSRGLVPLALLRLAHWRAGLP